MSDMYPRPLNGFPRQPSLQQNNYHTEEHAPYSGRNSTAGHPPRPVINTSPYGQQPHVPNHVYPQPVQPQRLPLDAYSHYAPPHPYALPPTIDMTLNQFGPYRGRRPTDHRDDFRQYNCDGSLRAPSPDERIPNEIIPTERKNRKTFRRVKPICHVVHGISYALQIVQQPIRARMCGNGDKDRRPITSPPILKVILRNVATGAEIDCESSKVLTNRFVVVADLYTPDGNREINLLRPRGTDNDTSAQLQTPAVYSQPVKRPSVAPQVTPTHQAIYGRSAFDQRAHHAGSLPPGSLSWSAPPVTGHDLYAAHVSPFDNNQWPDHQRHPVYNTPVSATSSNAEIPEPEASDNSGVVRQMIGNTVASGQLLPDPEGKKGIFFVFNDLSIRQDQWFRISFSLFYIGELMNVTTGPDAPAADPHPMESVPEQSVVTIGTGAAPTFEIGEGSRTSPCLAKTWSQPFRVYQAKRFPGVVSSGLLSKHFADLGCKIAIRVAKPKKQATSEGQPVEVVVKTKKRRRSGDNAAADEEEEDKIATMDDLPGDSDEEGEYQVRAP